MTDMEDGVGRMAGLVMSSIRVLRDAEVVDVVA